jgi:hypothetical protein
MAFNARFYVNRLVKAKAISATGDFADKGGAALDFCPDTYETGILSSSACQLDIDADATLPSAVLPTGYTWAGLWLRNPHVSFGGSASLSVKSDNADTFASPTTLGTLSFATAGIAASQHLLLVTFSSMTERYLRFDFSNMSVAPDVAMVMAGTYHDVTRTWDFPRAHGTSVRHGVRHFNRVDEMPDGRQVAMNMRSRGVQGWPTQWSLIDKTNYESLVTVHNLCRGRFIPFVFVTDDDTAMSDHFLMRFSTDAPDCQEPAHELYNIGIPMEEVASTDGGEVF